MDKNYMNEKENRESMLSWFGRVWSTYFFSLVGVNLLFVLMCIPVVTIPAACCGLHAVVQQFYRNIYGNTVFRTFFKEFKDSFVQRMALVLGVVAVPVLVAVLTSRLVSSVVWLVLCSVSALAAILVLSWMIPQFVLLNLKPAQALRNALIFTCIETKANFLLMILHVVCLTVVVYVWPVSAFLLLFLPVLNAVLSTGLVMPTLNKYLVQDHQEVQNTEEN